MKQQFFMAVGLALAAMAIASTSGNRIYLHEGTCETYDNVLQEAVVDRKTAKIKRPLSWSRLAGKQYALGFRSGWEWLVARPSNTSLTQDLVKEVHRRVMEQQITGVIADANTVAIESAAANVSPAARPAERTITAGAYRTEDAWVLEHTFPNPTSISESMAALLESSQMSAPELDNPEETFHQAAALVAGLLTVHPFADGNGRTAVLLGNWMLHLHGYSAPIDFQQTTTTHADFIFSLWVHDATADVSAMARVLQESFLHATTSGSDQPLVAMLAASGCAPGHALNDWVEPARKVTVPRKDRTAIIEIDIKGALPTVLYGRRGAEGNVPYAEYFRMEEKVFGRLSWEVREACKGEYLQQNFRMEHFSPMCESTKVFRKLLNEACAKLDDCLEGTFQSYAEVFYRKLQDANRNFLTGNLSLIDGVDFLVYGDQIVLKDTTDDVKDAAYTNFMRNFEELVPGIGSGFNPIIEANRVSLDKGVSFEQKTAFFAKYSRFQRLLGIIGSDYQTHSMQTLSFQPAYVKPQQQTYDRTQKSRQQRRVDVGTRGATAAPTAAPTSAPTFAPTAAPTSAPTSTPTASPTPAPTATPMVPWKEVVVADLVDEEGFTTVTRFVVSCVPQSCASAATPENEKSGCEAALAEFKAQNIDSSKFTCSVVCIEALAKCAGETDRGRRESFLETSDLRFLVVGSHDKTIETTAITATFDGTSYTSKMSETKEILYVSTEGAPIARSPDELDVVFDAPPFVWETKLGCCRERNGKAAYSHHDTARAENISPATKDEALTSCTAACETDGGCTAVEVTTKKKTTSRCEFHTSTINSASRASKSCKEAVCMVKVPWMEPTAAPQIPVAPPTPAPTAAPTPTPPTSPWDEKRGCCREFDGKKKLGHNGSAKLQAIPGATSFPTAAVACKQLCLDASACTAAEIRQQRKKKKTLFKCELHFATINSSTRGSKSCKKAMCSIKVNFA